MSSARDVRRFTRRLFAWFLLTTVVPAVALLWLAWGLVGQDRDRERAARAASREQAAGLAAASLQRRLAELEEQLSSFAFGPDTPPVAGDVAIVRFGHEGMGGRAGLPLLFHPVTGAPAAAAPLDAAFAQADVFEFVRRDPAAALALVEPLTRAVDPVTQAEAWLRTGQLRRKQGRITAALEAFERLAGIEATLPDGQPAGLLGAQGRALLFEASGNLVELASIAAELVRNLDAGRWVVSRTQFEFARHQAGGWLRAAGRQGPDDPDPQRVALSLAAEAAWRDWERSDTGSPRARSRVNLRVNGHAVLVLTRGAPAHVTVMLVGPAALDRAVREAAQAPGGEHAVDLALTDAEGPVIGDPRASADRAAVLLPDATGLPWAIHAMTPAAAPDPALSGQAVLMLVAIGIMLAVVAAGGYLNTRALARELGVARLQADFVAAVSHEFRTPLTTMRHLSELLARGRVATDAKRSEFYGILVRESDRLQRLVEGLLGFATLEAGQARLRLAPVSLPALLHEVVRDVRAMHADGRVVIELAGDEAGPPVIQADREVLSRVFWNLLDNAVKYSSGDARVRVDVSREGARALVRVRDTGMGIPADEQRRIFHKFVRGAAAKAASIRGTGIGLATADEIVRAHGGEISLESVVGQGSTFTVSLPIAADVAPGERAVEAADVTADPSPLDAPPVTWAARRSEHP